MAKKPIRRNADFNNLTDSYLWQEEIAKFLTVEDWHYVGTTGEPAFTGTINWANTTSSTDAPAAFYKDPFNRVHIKGAIRNGTNGESAWTLPAGYRPEETLTFSVTQSSAAEGAWVVIASSGTVIIIHSGATGSTPVYLDNISFRAA